jgi:polyhydroxyalkanoate synthesis repressor PhaR
MSDTRIIKKYPNRRLYDTGRSCYITLADVQALVVARVPFTVLEQRSGTDLTHIVLLQVIAGLEERRPSLLTQPFLQELIRRYGSVDNHALSRSLERALEIPG